jgi:hypothetical protein
MIWSLNDIALGLRQRLVGLRHVHNPHDKSMAIMAKGMASMPLPKPVFLPQVIAVVASH